ncbi:MAG: hypothetical protein IT245_03810 [Bacteroidia bacterium]|nr:hypothetical protein [Bacteroidia bacterium]
MKPIVIKFYIKKTKQGNPIGFIEDKGLKRYKVTHPSQLEIITELEKVYSSRTNTVLANPSVLQRIQAKQDGVMRYQRQYNN